VPDSSGLGAPTLGAGIQDPYTGGTAAQTADGGSAWVSLINTGIDLAFETYVIPAAPTSTAQCKNGGWRTFGTFKNQGDCVSSVAG
jgi:hypothetical protein